MSVNRGITHGLRGALFGEAGFLKKQLRVLRLLAAALVTQDDSRFPVTQDDSYFSLVEMMVDS